MDLRKRGPEYHPVDLQDIGEQGEHVELTMLPKSRAPSYTSTAYQSRYAEDDDKISLVNHAYLPSGLGTTAAQIVPWIQGRRKKFQGWRFGVSRSAWLAASVLVLNTLITGIAVAKFGFKDGIGTAYTGSCSRANSLATGLHLLINALSSVLLSASNYTMQALVAPTRAEVDRAHSKGDWMDIGVASVRNLSRIKWYRTLLWTILALSSVPIHLLYNSAVFKSIDTNEYTAMAANPMWLEGGNFSTNVGWTVRNNYSALTLTYLAGNDSIYDIQKFFHANLYDKSLVSNLSASECISAYSSTFLSGRQNVVAITNERGNSSNETLFLSWTVNSKWLCMDKFYESKLYESNCDTQLLDAQNWRINGKKIDYCLSQLQQQHCTVQFSVHILIAVICMNAMKSIVMFITVYGQKECTLVTIGDAVASFLEKPDHSTAGRCLSSRQDVPKERLCTVCKRIPKAYKDHGRSRWFAAASKARWVTCFALIGATIVAGGSLIGMGISSITANGSSPWSIGWGAIDTSAVIQPNGNSAVQLPQDGAEGLIVSVLIANCPQALVSFLYLLYNSLLTSLLLAKEWSSYAFRRKGLRVTTRNGAYQRSTYYLQLPLRYSVPLLCISATLHWIISQSIFLVRIMYYYNGKRDPQTGDITSIGFSLPPILTAIIIGLVMSAFAIGLGFRRLGRMPVAGSCSMAISAACHRPEDDVDAALLPVQWGEVEGTKDGFSHACFTSRAVTPLVPGRMYA